jgi:hypothetical protein
MCCSRFCHELDVLSGWYCGSWEKTGAHGHPAATAAGTSLEKEAWAALHPKLLASSTSDLWVACIDMRSMIFVKQLLAIACKLPTLPLSAPAQS